ncbi:MAG TPA: gliding motility-associated C-terminal domain-containing protein [Saprospiraceae bacterium]|nr:gliding motility-associated C-terminal domain-containing protein [Saprospiraceae bacterium]
MRLILLIVVLGWFGAGYSQGSGFTFTYTGPTQIIVGQQCLAPLNWGAPGTPTVTSNIPGGMIVSFGVYSISGGYHINDPIHGGNTVTVFYQAVDNFGNTALFGFSIVFIDIVPPVFDPFSLPQNITINCASNLPPPANVEATDNCAGEDPPLTITYVQTGNVAICGGGIIKRTWVADDDLGNTSIFIQMINVTPDVTPPVITNNLQNGSAPCATAMSQYATWLAAQRAAFTATDNGCGLMSKTDNAQPASQITSFCGVVTVTFTAKDNCNNSSTVDKTFTVTNNVAPVITTAASGATGNCSQNNINQVFNNWIANHGGAAATDDCSSIFWTTSPASPAIHDTCDAAIAVMFIAGDGCGNFDTTSASFTLTDDTGPSITVQPSTSILNCSSATLDSLLMDWLVDAGHSQAHDLCTADADLGLIYRVGGNDLNLEETLDAWQDSLVSGCHDNVVINGVGINNVKAYLEVHFVYTDKCNNEGTATGFFGITDNGKPVFVTSPVDTSFTCSANQTWQDVFNSWYNAAGGATYSDACSAVSVNASMTADSAMNILSAFLDTACMQGAHVTIQFGLTDDCGNTSLTSPSATFNLSDTIPPVLLSPALDFIASCSVNGSEAIQNWIDTLAGASASDGCGSLEWMFSWTDTSGAVINGIPGTGPYPSVATLDCSTGLEVIFTASDACSNSVSDTAVFSFIDTIPPVITIAEDSIHLLCQDTIPLTFPQVSDGCTDSLILSFVDVAGIDSCFGQPNIVNRTWTAQDACGNSSTAMEVFLRFDTIPPSFSLPSDTVQFCSVDTLFLVNVLDNCDPSPVTSWVDMLLGLPCHQTLQRIWTVTDACGNFTSAFQQFDLSDTSPPTITHSPGDFIYSCNASSGDLQDVYEQWTDSVTITDGCSETDYFIALRGSYVLADTATWPGTPVPDSIILFCTPDFVIEADLVAYDVCGNVVVEEISFSVIDTTGPVFTSCQAVIPVLPDTSGCNAIVTLVKPGVDDVCFPDTIHMQLQIDGGVAFEVDTILSLDTLLDVGIHSALWTATDCKGNVGTCLSSIEIIDENAVELTCPSDTLLFTDANSCSTSLWVFPPQTESGKCAKGVVVLRVEVQGNATPDSVIFSSATDSVLVTFMSGIHNVLLIARDSTGDIDTCIYLVELRDTILPSIICQNDTLLLPPSGIDNVDLSTTSLVVSTADNCGIQNIVYDPPFVNCNNYGQNVPVTITATDLSGNVVSCVSSLFVLTQPLSPQWSRGLCDDTLRLFANLPPGPPVNYIFTWTGPNSFGSADENPVLPGSDSTFSGTYFLTVQNDSGCISTGSVEVLIQTLTLPSITPSDDTICAGDEIILTTQNYSGNVSYQWYEVLPNGDTVLTNTIDPVLTLFLSDPGTHIFFAVVIQDTCSSEPGPDVAIFVSPIPDVSILEGMMPLCIADTLYLLPQTIDTSLIYHWTGPNGFESFESNPPGIPVSDIDSGAVFILTASNLFCTSIPDTLIVLVQNPPGTPVITGDSVTCKDGTFVLVANSSAESFEWIDPSGNIIVTTNDSLLVFLADTSDEGSWGVIAFINGCPSDTSAAFNVRIDTTIAVQIIGPVAACEGDSVQLSVVPANPGTYAWTGPNGFTSDEISPLVLAQNGIYTVSVLTATGCASADTFTLQVDVLPAITSLSTDADSCVNGASTIHITPSIDPVDNGSYVYHWEGPSGFNSQDSLLAFNNATSDINGVYTLYIENGACTSDTSSIELSLNDSPEAPVISGDNVYCFGDTIILSITSPISGGIYTWTSSDTTAVINSPGTLIIPHADQTLTGIYKVEVTVDGCTSSKTQFAVQVRPPLSAPVIQAPVLVCEGDSLVLTSNAPGVIVEWTGPGGFTSNEVSPVIFPATPANAGFYSVFYTINGCESPVSIPVEIKVQSSLATPGLNADLTRICLDDPSPVNLCLETGSGTPGATYTWILNANDVIGTPGTDSCIVINGSPLLSGINSITVISSLQGCLSDTSEALIIIADETPEQNANAGPNLQFCPDETIELEAIDPSPSTGVWTTPMGEIVFSDINNPHTTLNALPPGNYELTWTLSFESCLNYSADDVFVDVLFSPQLFADTVSVPFGQTIQFTATANDIISPGPFILEVISGTHDGNLLHAGNGIFRYTPNIGFVGTDFFTYRICSTECPEECSEATVVLHVGNEDDCIVPTLFTPNEDGVNDVLIIPCLESSRFPENKIIVFNEWGAVVYTSSPYQNDWDGTISGESLPVGTYFYIMDFGDGSEPRRTFLVLER